jgi:hypothetical protein
LFSIAPLKLGRTVIPQVEARIERLAVNGHLNALTLWMGMAMRPTIKPLSPVK